MNLQLNNKKNNPYRKDPSSVTKTYVYTNPKSTTIITHRDKAFVLGIEFPSEDNAAAEANQKEGNLQM